MTDTHDVTRLQLDTWAHQVKTTGRTFKTVTAKHLNKSGNVGHFAVTHAALDLIYAATKAGHFANELLDRKDPPHA